MAGMRLGFIADLNSIHSRKFIGYFPPRGHEVLVISTTPFAAGSFAGARVLSLETADEAGGGHGFPGRAARALPRILDALARRATAWNPELQLALIQRAIARQSAQAIAQRLAFCERHRELVRRLVADFQPDLLQCLRMPVEGYLGSYAEHPRTLQFCWGNDLTLYARRYPAYAELTRRALSGCAGFLADCRRDIRLAPEWGLRSKTPTLVTPGGGGLETDRLEREEREARPGGRPSTSGGGPTAAPGNPPAPLAAGGEPSAPGAGPPDAPLTFLTLRGLGGRYTDNIPVLRAVPRMRTRLGENFRLRFVGSRGPHLPLLQAEARRLGIRRFLEFPGRLPHAAVPAAIRGADFVFSATHHDGTPNSMLETMWHGGIPLCSDLESIREWITDGENGYLFDMSAPEQIADAFLRAVDERERHADFRAINRRLIKERADYATCMARVETFYYQLLAR